MKKLTLSLLITLFSATANLSAQEPPKSPTSDLSALALPERRGVKEYQEKIWPELKKKIEATAGYEVPIEIAWETIAIKGSADQYSQPDFWTNIYFEPLTEALKTICKDADGQQALKQKLKKIVIKYIPDKAPSSAYEEGVKFEEGTLSINWTPYTNVNDKEQRHAALISVVQPKL